MKHWIKQISYAKKGYEYLDARVRGYIDSDSDYEKLNYEKFMKLMLHQIDLPLATYDNRIDIEKLPKDIELIYHSTAKRSEETATFVRDALGGEPIFERRCPELVAEVQFSDDIVSPIEFKKRDGLSGCRELILERWYRGINLETFEDSYERAQKLYLYLLNRSEKTILVVTHGWYLRLLKLFFRNSTPISCDEISYDELVKVKPPAYGEYFRVNLQSPQQRGRIIVPVTVVMPGSTMIPGSALVSEKSGIPDNPVASNSTTSARSY